MAKIGSLELGKKACVAAIIDHFESMEDIIELKELGANLLEVRVDLLDAPLGKITEYIHRLKRDISLPMIGTVRETEKNSRIRTDIFKEIMPFVDCVDIELGSPISEDICRFTGETTIMVSEHNFEKTPSNSELSDIVKRACDQNAQIVKIAVMANSSADVRRLMHFTESCEKPLVSIAMGQLGTVSRVIAPLFGSLFTYGYIRNAVAPGQLSAKKLIEERDLFFLTNK